MERPLIKIGKRFINVLAITNTEVTDNGGISIWVADRSDPIPLDHQQGSVLVRVLRRYATDADNPV